MSKVYWIILLTAIVAVGCTSQTKEISENAVYEKCVVYRIPLGTSAEGMATIYIKRVSDNIVIPRVMQGAFDVGDTVLIRFDKRYDYATL